MWCLQQLRSASRLGRLRVLAREFAGDVHSLWRYGAPFPTFLKLIGTLLLCLLVIMPLIYPVFVLAMTYFTYEGLYLRYVKRGQVFIMCQMVGPAGLTHDNVFLIYYALCKYANDEALITLCTLKVRDTSRYAYHSNLHGKLFFSYWSSTRQAYVQLNSERYLC